MKPAWFSNLTLSNRLLLASIISSAIILLCAGFVLSTVYVTSAERAVDQRLELYLQGLSRDVSGTGEGDVLEIESYGETKFETYRSGWYWQIERLDEGNQYRLASKSLGSDALPIEIRSALLREGRYTFGPLQEKLRVVERMIEDGENGRYRMMVGVTSIDLENDIFNFNRALALTLSLLGLALTSFSFVHVRFGLAPLQALKSAVQYVRLGHASRISGVYPRDLAPLAQELNLLIDANRTIIERARTQAGNLAHALKTPLSIMMNEAQTHKTPLADLVREQTAAMNVHIVSSLNRAQMAAIGDGANPIGNLTHADPAIERLLKMFKKLYHDRSLTFEVKVQGGSLINIEAQDFDDICANLIDNACKWASKTVKIALWHDQENTPPQWQLVVEDDGKGLNPQECALATQRGQRLDTVQSGSGLGLSIVNQITILYDGSLVLDQSLLGGLRASVRLPDKI